ncbi:hypothetical protein [Ideonella sp.]|uniref:hypothetical protein n=1 Tax=Ideonella sp. TaxID=1929293 RepID=UPI003BB7E8C1
MKVPPVPISGSATVQVPAWVPAPQPPRPVRGRPRPPVLATADLDALEPTGAGPASTPDRIDLSAYSVTATAPRRMKVKEAGELKVVIGLTADVRAAASGVVAATVPLRGSGRSVKVKPFVSPELTLDQAESPCALIDAGGSELRFRFTPQRDGRFKVGADVALYGSTDCTGTPVPKAVETVEVEVSIDTGVEVQDGAMQLLRQTWKAVVDFWDKLLLLVFGLLLLSARKRISARLGLGDKEAAAPGDAPKG